MFSPETAAKRAFIALMVVIGMSVALLLAHAVEWPFADPGVPRVVTLAVLVICIAGALIFEALEIVLGIRNPDRWMLVQLAVMAVLWVFILLCGTTICQSQLYPEAVLAPGSLEECNVLMLNRAITTALALLVTGLSVVYGILGWTFVDYDYDTPEGERVFIGILVATVLTGVMMSPFFFCPGLVVKLL